MLLALDSVCYVTLLILDAEEKAQSSACLRTESTVIDLELNSKKNNCVKTEMYYMRFDVLFAVMMSMFAVQVVISRELVGKYKRFGVTYCFHLQCSVIFEHYS